MLRAGIVGVDHGQQSGRGGFEDFIAAFDGAFCTDLAIAEIQHFFHIGDLGQGELFSDLGTDLCGITVDRLSAAEDQIEITDLSCATAESEAGCQSVSAAEGPVGQQDRFIRAAAECVAEDACCGGQPHGCDNDIAVVTFFQLECEFQSVEVFGIENRRQCRTIHSSILFHCLSRHVLGVRDLLHEYDDFAGHCNVLLRFCVRFYVSIVFALFYINIALFRKKTNHEAKKKPLSGKKKQKNKKRPDFLRPVFKKRD